MTFKAYCPVSCLSDCHVYGDKIYSPTSRVCAAAHHAGAITKNGGYFYIRIVEGQSCYNAALSFNI
jgi:hypothetical protein